jgi:hypothetical protein
VAQESLNLYVWHNEILWFTFLFDLGYIDFF